MKIINQHDEVIDDILEKFAKIKHMTEKLTSLKNSFIGENVKCPKCGAYNHS